MSDHLTLLTRAEAAELLRVPTQTLANWWSQGKGPRGFKYGRHVRYDKQDVLAWLAAHRAHPTPRRKTRS